ncbi:hypothetical protein [Longirhabdus pacifica]|uniref:hypothetical protein n=1 Tax=Longirhabdus pacifica TaxID=2305227 RepID=UPI0010092F26|nr:hypothetical protein [Longirhabdus pacifica]
MNTGVYSVEERLRRTKKMLKEKEHLKHLIQEDVNELEHDVKQLEEMLAKETSQSKQSVHS